MNQPLPPRKTYKFSSSVGQGGFLYAHKVSGQNLIQDKQGLKDALVTLTKQLGLLDVTIKVYDEIFFLFYLPKPSAKPPLELFKMMRECINPFGEWSEEHVYTTAYDLQEPYVRRDLSRFGFDYEKGI